jgi:hypothetical protein
VCSLLTTGGSTGRLTSVLPSGGQAVLQRIITNYPKPHHKRLDDIMWRQQTSVNTMIYELSLAVLSHIALTAVAPAHVTVTSEGYKTTYLRHSSSTKMETLRSSVTSVNYYQTTRRHIPVNRALHIQLLILNVFFL